MTSVIQLGFTVSAPPAPTAAAGLATGALGAAQVYQYKVTYLSGFGETNGGATASVTTTSTGSVQLTNLPVFANANVIGRNIYRTIGGGSTFLLLAHIADNTTTSYLDVTADGSLGVAIPTLNSAESIQNFVGIVGLPDQSTFSVTNGITAGAGGTQAAATPLTSRYSFITTVTTTNDSVILPELNSTQIGRVMTIHNNGANTARIYPFGTQQINSGGASTPITVAAAATVQLVAVSATNWNSF